MSTTTIIVLSVLCGLVGGVVIIVCLLNAVLNKAGFTDEAIKNWVRNR